MEYKDIYKPLIRTSFASKMELSFHASCQIMSITGQIGTERQVKYWLPDEIECFVLNSVIANEYKETKMEQKQFIDIMNAIRKYIPSKYYDASPKDRIKWILSTFGLTQFEHQEYSFFRLYRHHNLFCFSNSDVDVNKEFTLKFGKSFNEYATIVLAFQLFLSEKKIDTFLNFWEKIAIKESWFIDNLKLTRLEYKQELSQFASSNEDYRYCLRPSYSYPFIEFDERIFLPTPHLLIQSITTAMMNRLTFGNDNLREKIGKNACEEYLHKIVKDSGLFDEIIPEYEYSKGQRTLDVMTRRENKALLIDSKFFSPKASIRNYDESAYEYGIGRMVEIILQMYEQARNKYNKLYHPFKNDIDQDNTYVIAVVYQDGYFDLETIYLNAAKKLSIEPTSDEFSWLIHHIGLTTMANFERFMLTQTDVFPFFEGRDSINDLWLTEKNDTDEVKSLSDYRNSLYERVGILVDTLYEQNTIA